jgi:hypothetical protein
MKHIFLVAGVILAAQIANADIIGSFSGSAQYKNDEGYTDDCTLEVSFSKEETVLNFYLSTLCTELEFDQSVPFELQNDEIYYNGEKVGILSGNEVLVKGMKVEDDVYSFRATQKDDNSVEYADKYCYGGEVCEELMGTLAPRVAIAVPRASAKRF